MDKVLYKWFTEMCSESKPVTGPMIIKKANFFNHETNITDKCTFSENSNKKLPEHRYHLIIQHLSGLMVTGLKEFYCN
jgi:hypothetical protein